MNNSEKNTGKVPPQNIDAEKSLLGAILIDEEDLIDVIENDKIDLDREEEISDETD